jgi:ribosome-associated heat shock protein Hsp15
MDSVRIDVWLWAARFFKTRSIAKKACELGRVTSQGVQVKPARDVRVGDRLRVTTEAGEFEIDVLGLSEMRGPAAVAQALYRETEQGREARLKLAEERKTSFQFEPSPIGRPSKRDRRRIIQFRRRGE